MFARLQELIGAINRMNSKTVFEKEQSISDAIAERDVVGKRRDFLAGIADAATTRQDRYSKSEVRFVATVSVGKLQTEVDQLAKRYRELDTRLHLGDSEEPESRGSTPTSYIVGSVRSQSHGVSSIVTTTC